MNGCVKFALMSGNDELLEEVHFLGVSKEPCLDIRVLSSDQCAVEQHAVLKHQLAAIEATENVCGGGRQLSLALALAFALA